MTDAGKELENAQDPRGLRRVVIDPVTRVEGHGKVTVRLDDSGHVEQARLHIVEFRGFEKFVQGRPYWEVPVLVQRLCGICPVSHHLAGAKAVDEIVGVKPGTGTELTVAAEKMRRLMHYGQMFQSHVLHFFYLCSPDLVFGVDGDVATRNIVGVIEDNPEIARQGIMLRKYGQEVIRLTAGKRIHGTGAVPGGVNKSLNREEREFLRRDIAQIVAWSQGAVGLIKRIFAEHFDYHMAFATIDSSMLSLVGDDGAFEIYQGGLRARDAQGGEIFDHVDPARYYEYLREGVRSWTYMKFPFISAIGPDEGWYRVGPWHGSTTVTGLPRRLPSASAGRLFRSGAGRRFRLRWHITGRA